MQQRASQWDQPERSDGSWELTVWNVLNLLHRREGRSLGHFSSWNAPQRMRSFITLPLWSCDAYLEQSVPMCLSGECDTIPSLSASCRRILPKLSKLWRLFGKPRASSSSRGSWQEWSWCSEYGSTTTKLLIWSWIWRSNWDSEAPWASSARPYTPNRNIHIISCFSMTSTLSAVKESARASVAKLTHLIFPPHPCFSHSFCLHLLSSLLPSRRVLLQPFLTAANWKESAVFCLVNLAVFSSPLWMNPASVSPVTLKQTFPSVTNICNQHAAAAAWYSRGRHFPPGRHDLDHADKLKK